MGNEVYVVGVGMTTFERRGRCRQGWTIPTWPRGPGPTRCGTPASDYTEVEQGYVGYVYGESTSGQRALHELGVTGTAEELFGCDMNAAAAQQIYHQCGLGTEDFQVTRERVRRRHKRSDRSAL